MILAGAAFLLALQPLPALDRVRWERLPGGDPNEPLAIDPGSIMRRGDRVTLIVHASGGFAYVARWTVDCRARVIVTGATDTYGADGVLIPNEPGLPAASVTLPLDSMSSGAALAARVCQARR